MLEIVKKIHKNIPVLRSILTTIWFNFHYLPFRQAIKLPILLYKPKLIQCDGKIILKRPAKYGMIRLGFHVTSIYPNTGITWENKGGTVRFNGHASIGNDSYLSFGRKTTVEFGDDFISSAGLKLISYREMKFGNHTSLGWEVLIMDTNFHPLFDLNKKVYKKASGSISIGEYNWFGTQCKIMHSVHTPDRCIFGMGSVVTRNCEMKSYCVMGGNPVKILSENVIRDYDHDREDDI